MLLLTPGNGKTVSKLAGIVIPLEMLRERICYFLCVLSDFSYPSRQRINLQFERSHCMKTSVGFVIGLLFGLGIAASAAQNNSLGGVNNMNHVGISVERFDEALAFYTQKMGFREAFTVRDDKGQPTLSYVQVSRDTFVELQPANANRPPGLTHFGLHVQDLKSTVATLKQRGVTVEDPRAGREDSMVANATGPGGMRIEIFQFGPESLQGRAISTWK